MFRDTHKDVDYFEKKKQQNERLVAKSSGLLKSVFHKSTNKYDKSLAYAYYQRFLITYSLGDSVEDLFEYYKKSLHDFKSYINKKTGMYETVDYFALGVLYSDKKEEFIDDLKVVYDKLVYTDHIVEYFAEYLFYGKVPRYRSILQYLNMIEEPTVENVKEAHRFWHYTHSDAKWYNSHLTENDYNGYWAFDMAAVCKIKGLFDSALKELPYFPYDLLIRNVED